MSIDGINDDSVTHVLPASAVSADQFLKHEYDFIIVGGGTAGLTLAARLTENPDVTVGVLEAGKNKLDDFLVDTPGLFTQLLGNEEYDWKFKTVPQPNGKEYHIPRGKMLGGTSGINFLMYVRGSTQDYDDWAILADDPSWGSEKMHHYMRKHQTLHHIDENIAHRTSMPFVAENHGTSGPIHTSFNDFLLPIEDDFQRGFNEVTGISQKPLDPYVSKKTLCFPTEC
jgi:choline dehydrogenase-like flavoprotein